MEKITAMSIDIETRSGTDLAKAGVYRYVEDADFDILLFGYAVNGGNVHVVDLAMGEKVPDDVLMAVVDDSVTKWAFNSSFERICLSEWLRKHRPDLFHGYGLPEDSTGIYLSPVSWRCSMVWAAYNGLPQSLEGVGAVLKLENQKMSEGKSLIRYFCVPCRPAAANDGRTWNLPEHAPDKWELFKTYNKRDVEVEMAIQHALRNSPVPEAIWDEYHLSEQINDRGIRLDTVLVDNAIQIDAESRDELSARMQELTQIDNPSSVMQMKQWLADHGIEVESLDKKAVRELLATAPPELAQVLELRQQLARSSVKKYIAMASSVCADSRCRGMFRFYGAGRTGRFAGRLVQLQNLVRNELPDLEQARSLVKAGDHEMLQMLYDDVPRTLSQLVRTAFIPKEGYKFVVADFSAIEARVIAWLAGEQWRLDLFAHGGDIYCQSASQMFGVPVEKHGVNGHLRAKGKVAELACIAEGQLVLTNHGEKPIETVTTDDLLWDGEAWVQHEGVIYKGVQEVITYEGLTATPDHLVWVEGKSFPVQLGFAAASGTHLIQTGDGGNPVRLGENRQPRKTLEREVESLLCVNGMHKLSQHPMDGTDKPYFWQIKRLSELFCRAKTSPCLAGEEAGSSKRTLQESKRPKLSKIRRAWNSLRVSLRTFSWKMDSGKRTKCASGLRIGSDRQQRKLCSGKHPFCSCLSEHRQQGNHRLVRVESSVLALRTRCSSEKTVCGNDEKRDHRIGPESCAGEKKELAYHQRKARLYDIRNAGPHHRFTVSNHLVHNCGYGGSVSALKAMGALEAGMKEEELQPLVDAWREANPHIVDLWWSVDDAIKRCIRHKTSTETHGIHFDYKSAMLLITLPSGRTLSYVKPKIGVNRFGGESITYEGVGATKKWERIESYGPKFVENIVQAIARDILCYAMQTLSHCFIVAHVHDELIIECEQHVSVEAICEQMARTPPWAKGLGLQADGGEMMWYQKE